MGQTLQGLHWVLNVYVLMTEVLLSFSYIQHCRVNKQVLEEVCNLKSSILLAAYTTSLKTSILSLFLLLLAPSFVSYYLSSTIRILVFFLASTSVSTTYHKLAFLKVNFEPVLCSKPFNSRALLHSKVLLPVT